MDRDKKIFFELINKIKTRVPEFEVAYKEDSKVSRIISKIVYIFNPKYMRSVVTTRYPKVYFPTRSMVNSNYTRAWKILAHEYVHLLDRKEHGRFLFNFAYFTPQCLSVLGLLSFLYYLYGSMWLFLSVFFLFLLPLPSPGRMYIEYRGYTMSMAVNFWRYGWISKRTKDWIYSRFTGSTYYMMWPFHNHIKKMFKESIASLNDDSIFNWRNADPFSDVHEILHNNKMLSDDS